MILLFLFFILIFIIFIIIFNPGDLSFWAYLFVFFLLFMYFFVVSLIFNKDLLFIMKW